jgi:CheY-like chemotaxis protein
MAVQTPDQSEKTSDAAAPAWQAARPIRILIIDDEEAVCRVIESALADGDFHVESISDPQQIDQRLSDDPAEAFDVVLLDLILPIIQPHQIFAWLRERQPEASVIVITGQPSFASAIDSLRARVFDYVTKPFSVAALRRVVTRCLESKGLLRLTDSALREAIGRAIRDRRKALDMTLAPVAARSGVSVGYVSQVELGKNNASIETLYRICLALRMPLSDLFHGIEREH